jgi:cephalosporin hydroxylase
MAERGKRHGGSAVWRADARAAERWRVAVSQFLRENRHAPCEAATTRGAIGGARPRP